MRKQRSNSLLSVLKPKSLKKGSETLVPPDFQFLIFCSLQTNPLANDFKEDSYEPKYPEAKNFDQLPISTATKTG
jgi:hypothetical protein